MSGFEPWTELPCARLQRLELAYSLGCNVVQLGRYGITPGVLASCAATLTSLILKHCEVDSPAVGPVGADDLCNLSVLVSLRHLELVSVKDRLSRQAPIFPGNILPSLAQHLRHLILSGFETVYQAHHVSRLTSLAVLHVSGISRGGGQPWGFSPHVAPTGDFCFPASICDLTLSDRSMVLDPVVLSPCVHMTRLLIKGVMIWADMGRVSGGGSLLSALAKLPHLHTVMLDPQFQPR